MPMTFEIDKAAKMVMIAVSGIPTKAEATRAMLDLSLNPDFQKGYAILSDNRSVFRLAAFDVVEAMIQACINNIDIFSASRISFVVQNDTSLGMMVLLAIRAETFGLKASLFWTKEEALKWLGEAKWS